ncbi:MAG TPA: hypothetical protein VM537_20410 [Anaerolineae bacterium]|nr:hypothetical protein [Anaerolineae bacterium]
MAKTAAQRLADAIAKRNELLDKGVPFNPEHISASGQARASDNLKGTNRVSAQRKVEYRIRGSVSAPSAKYR